MMAILAWRMTNFGVQTNSEGFVNDVDFDSQIYP